jgi:hypothetical protein
MAVKLANYSTRMFQEIWDTISKTTVKSSKQGERFSSTPTRNALVVR